MYNKSQHKENNQQIDVELSEEMAEGIYANLAMIAHSNSEFVIDFIRLMPGIPKAKVKSRLVLTAEHAVRLSHALRENIEKYEATFGKIRLTEESNSYPKHFQSTHADEMGGE